MRTTEVEQPQLVTPHGLMVSAALMLMVFLHKDVGGRQLRSKYIILISAAPLICCYWAAPYFFLPGSYWYQTLAPNNPAMAIFVVAFLVRAFWLRHDHWKKIHAREGRVYATMSPGVTRLKDSGEYSAVYRFVQPAGCALIGYFIKNMVSFPLGFWIIYCSFALFLYERWIWHTSMRRRMDLNDAMAEGEFVEHANRVGRSRDPSPDDGIATGLDDMQDDLDALRRARRS